MTTSHERLRELGITLPAAPAPVASYVATRMVAIDAQRSLLYVAGQISRDGQQLLAGRCPDQVTLDEGRRRARVAAVNVLAQIESAIGLDNLVEMAQVVGYVLSGEGFGDQPKVIDGASDLFVDVLGDAGRHTRLALGTNALPFSATVEIAAVAVVRTG